MDFCWNVFALDVSKNGLESSWSFGKKLTWNSVINNETLPGVNSNDLQTTKFAEFPNNVRRWNGPMNCENQILWIVNQILWVIANDDYHKFDVDCARKQRPNFVNYISACLFDVGFGWIQRKTRNANQTTDERKSETYRLF